MVLILIFAEVLGLYGYEPLHTSLYKIIAKIFVGNFTDSSQTYRWADHEHSDWLDQMIDVCNRTRRFHIQQGAWPLYKVFRKRV